MTIMKKILLILSLIIVSCQERTIERTYYDDGKLKEEFQVIDGEKDGYYKLFHKTGNLSEHLFYEDGNFFSTEWRKTYYPNGKDKIHYYFFMRSIDNVEAWDTNGVQVVKDGTGTFIDFDSLGNKFSQTTFQNGTINDTIFVWYPNGVLERIMVYSDGKPSGIWKWWYNNGELDHWFNRETGEMYPPNGYTAPGVTVE